MRMFIFIGCDTKYIAECDNKNGTNCKIHNITEADKLCMHFKYQGLLFHCKSLCSAQAKLKEITTFSL